MPTVQAPTVQATVQDFSARQTQEIGQATASLGAGLQRIAVQLQDDINETEAKDGDVKIGDVIDGLTYAEDGYFTKKGKDALGYNRQKLLDTVRNESMKIAGTMPNAMARRMYERSAQARIERLENQVLGYAFEQTQKAKQDATASRMLRLSRDQIAYADSWKMPGSAFQKTRAVWEGEFSELLKQQSIAPDSDKAAVLREDALTPVHSEIVTKLIDQGKVDQAREYLDAVTSRAVDQQDPQTGAVRKGVRELTPEAETNLRKSLRVGETKDAAQRYVLSPEINALPTLQDKIDKLNADFSNKAITIDVRDQAEDRLRAADVLRRDGEAQVANKAFADFQRWAMQPENRWKSANDWPDAARISVLQDKGMWDNAIQFKRTSSIDSTPEAFLEATEITRSGQWGRDEFKTPQLTMAYFSSNGRSISDSDMRAVLALREEALYPQRRNVEVTRLTTAEERFVEWARGPSVNILSQDPKEDTPEQKQRFMRARDLFQKRLNMYETQVIRGKATPAQVDEVLRQMDADRALVPTKQSAFRFANPLYAMRPYYARVEPATQRSIMAMSEEESKQAFVRVDGQRVALGDIDQGVISYYEDMLISAQDTPSFQRIAESWVRDGKPVVPPADYIKQKMGQ